MRFEPTSLPEVILIEPRVHRDARGFFLESYHAQRFAEGGISARFVQDNHSRSALGVLRGLHFQRSPRAQGKLVRVTKGRAFDVAVDIRPDSPRFGQWTSAELSAANFRQIWIPTGFAHGFLAMEEDTHVQYKTTDYYSRELEGCILWSDPSIGIRWPLPDGSQPILSPKDAVAPGLMTLMREA